MLFHDSNLWTLFIEHDYESILFCNICDWLYAPLKKKPLTNNSGFEYLWSYDWIPVYWPIMLFV